MPSGKRETERKGNTPVNTGPSPNSDGRTYNLVEEADGAARGSGSLHDLPNHLSELLAYVTCQPLLQAVFYYLQGALM
ncbi:hypothetical protein T03_15158 [Trichinella britovi]|uniref:Uncharacterized protein n=1 Tax=Trichinella britovi TaxID=45882 RepID=A0A0V1C6L3_TRIBR|nr:hypothetical protein T03_15158 [Trichinella britovi]